MDWTALLIAALGCIGSLTGAYFSNRKNNALIAYRISELEKKQDKHNNLIERTYKLEERVSILEEKEKER